MRPIRAAAITLAVSVVVAFLGSLLLPSVLLALPSELERRAPDKPAPQGIYTGGGRTGGDTAAEATPIAALPFADTGNTCGFDHNYDAICPYTGSTAPDVVYVYVPSVDETLQIDLCSSAYDTKVYVYEDAVGILAACNDDYGCGYSGWQSRIDFVEVQYDHLYYIVVDGYGTSCGDYSIDVRAAEPCDVVCPPGAQLEGEPPCVDNYYDYYNSGCGGSGWTPVEPQQGNCATVCGRACTYDYQGLTYRDTDWYWANASGGTVTMSVLAEFPVQVILIYGTNCANLQYVLATGPPCEPTGVSWYCAPEQELWPWVGPLVFSGVPDSEYVLQLCGIGPPVTYVGACCDAVTGACSVLSEEDCVGFWGGPYGSCSPNPCLYNGACCHGNGQCSVLPAPGCASLSGDWHGPYTDCSPSPCPPTTHACCLSDGSCAVLSEADCAAAEGVWLTASDTCAPGVCLGACCQPTGECVLVPTEADCPEGAWIGPGVSCTPDPCWDAFGACCFPDGTCEIHTVVGCAEAGGEWMGLGVNCYPDPCEEPTPVEQTTWGRLKQRYR